MSKLSKLYFAIAFSAILPRFAYACSTCFGDPESPMTHGMNMAILLLLGVTGSILAGFVALFLHFRKMGQRELQRQMAMESNNILEM